MFKNIISYLRWGSLSSEQKEKLKSLSLKKVFTTPYLIRRY